MNLRENTEGIQTIENSLGHSTDSMDRLQQTSILNTMNAKDVLIHVGLFPLNRINEHSVRAWRKLFFHFNDLDNLYFSLYIETWGGYLYKKDLEEQIEKEYNQQFPDVAKITLKLHYSGHHSNMINIDQFLKGDKAILLLKDMFIIFVYVEMYPYIITFKELSQDPSVTELTEEAIYHLKTNIVGATTREFHSGYVECEDVIAQFAETDSDWRFYTSDKLSQIADLAVDKLETLHHPKTPGRSMPKTSEHLSTDTVHGDPYDRRSFLKTFYLFRQSPKEIDHKRKVIKISMYYYRPSQKISSFPIPTTRIYFKEKDRVIAFCPVHKKFCDGWIVRQDAQTQKEHYKVRFDHAHDDGLHEVHFRLIKSPRWRAIGFEKNFDSFLSGGRTRKGPYGDNLQSKERKASVLERLSVAIQQGGSSNGMPDPLFTDWTPIATCRKLATEVLKYYEKPDFQINVWCLWCDVGKSSSDDEKVSSDNANSELVPMIQGTPREWAHNNLEFIHKHLSLDAVVSKQITWNNRSLCNNCYSHLPEDEVIWYCSNNHKICALCVYNRLKDRKKAAELLLQIDESIPVEIATEISSFLDGEIQQVALNVGDNAKNAEHFAKRAAKAGTKIKSYDKSNTDDDSK